MHSVPSPYNIIIYLMDRWPKKGILKHLSFILLHSFNILSFISSLLIDIEESFFIHSYSNSQRFPSLDQSTLPHLLPLSAFFYNILSQWNGKRVFFTLFKSCNIFFNNFSIQFHPQTFCNHI